MPDVPAVRPGDEIRIGTGPEAIVATSPQDDDSVEAVYLDTKGVAIAERVCWTGEGWEFASRGPAGTYAENSARFGRFARELKAKARARRRRR